MKHRLTTLPNGLRIATAEMADSYSVTVNIAAGVGSRYEDFPHNGGVSHFLEHLLFKGTKKRPSTKIITEQIDAVGGFNNASTSNDMTSYYVKLPYQHINLALDILADMLTNSLFEPKEINRERGVVLEEMNVMRDDPARYVFRLTPPLLWPKHPLAEEVIGSEEVIKSISRSQIIGFQKEHYQPGNMVVAAAGRLNHDLVVKQVTELLGGLSKKTFPRATPVKRVLSEQKTAAFEKDTAQAHLTIGAIAYPYRHPKDAVARVIATALGQGLSSRLFLNVRERKGLAYTVYASLERFVDTGEFAVYAGVNLDKVSQALGAIIEELERIRHEPIGDEELNKAKNQIGGGLQMAMENNAAVSDNLSSQLVLLGSIRTVEAVLAEINAVTAKDVKKVAFEMLAPEKLRLGIISPNPAPSLKTFEKLTGR